MTPTGARRVPVPDGLDGERLDAALARMFGLSRTQAQDLVGNGAVLVSGSPAAKSDRVRAGDWVDVTLPPPPVQPLANPEPVPGLGILYEDTDIVVVDKPVGVAAHPTPGWTGPTVLQGLLAAGHTVATSGAAERQGIVHRLDAGTTGVMVVAKSDHAYSVLKQASATESWTSGTTPWCRAIPTRCGGQSTLRSPATHPATAGSRSCPTAARR